MISYLLVVEQHRTYFFFSSRRRHTRLQGDWSSDVCSSDLSLRPASSPPTCRARRRIGPIARCGQRRPRDRKSTRLNSSHLVISYAVFCLKKKKNKDGQPFTTKNNKYIIVHDTTTDGSYKVR